MRLTTLRALVVATTVLVAAAATCLATFADVPAGALSAATDCSPNDLVFADAGTALDGTNATTTFAVESRGPACLLARVPHVTAFDATGNPVPLVSPKRVGVMRFVLRPLLLPPGGRATFTVQTAHQGAACDSVARMSLAFDDGTLDAATKQIACTRDVGSNVTISFFALDPPTRAPRS